MYSDDKPSQYQIITIRKSEHGGTNRKLYSYIFLIQITEGNLPWEFENGSNYGNVRIMEVRNKERPLYLFVSMPVMK